MPGTAGGTMRERVRTVASATSDAPAWAGQPFPETTMFGFSSVPSRASGALRAWKLSSQGTLALILLFGIEFLPWLFVAPVLADGIVRGFALPFPAEIAAGVTEGCGPVA